MTDLATLTISQLKGIIAIKEQIEALQGQIGSIAAGAGEVPSAFTEEASPTKKRRMSAAARAKIAAAQRARWAKVKRTAKSKPVEKGQTATLKAAKKKDRRSSPAVRAKLAAAAKARWAKVKAEGKTTL